MNKQSSIYEKSIIELKDSTMIWRYVTFAEFIYILEKKVLFFVRADKLKDRYEGSITKRDKKDWQNIIKKLNLPNTFLRDSVLRKSVVINSWHSNNYESVVMWNEHTNPEEGVVIQTTVADLKESISSKELIIRKIFYTDYDEDRVAEDYLSPFFSKLKEYEAENEVRALFCKIPQNIEGKVEYSFKEGLYVSLNINKLIKKIYISPDARKWFFELVYLLVEKEGLNAMVCKSRLSKKPIYY